MTVKFVDAASRPVPMASGGGDQTASVKTYRDPSQGDEISSKGSRTVSHVLHRLTRRSIIAASQPLADPEQAEKASKAVRQPQAYAILSSRIPPENHGGPKLVKVGCVPGHQLGGWWNTAQRPFPGIDETINPTHQWRWRDLLHVAYAERFIEQLPIEMALRFMAHAGGALQRGGRIRLSTVSLEWVMKTHFNFDECEFGPRLSGTFAINRAFHGWGHKFLYSKEMLTELLKQVGLEDIRFYKTGESDMDELKGIERHSNNAPADGYEQVWIVEAVRGDARPSVGIWADAWIRENYTNHMSDQ